MVRAWTWGQGISCLTSWFSKWVEDWQILLSSVRDHLLQEGPSGQRLLRIRLSDPGLFLSWTVSCRKVPQPGFNSCSHHCGFLVSLHCKFLQPDLESLTRDLEGPSEHTDWNVGELLPAPYHHQKSRCWSRRVALMLRGIMRLPLGTEGKKTLINGSRVLVVTHIWKSVLFSFSCLNKTEKAPMSPPSHPSLPSRYSKLILCGL